MNEWRFSWLMISIGVACLCRASYLLGWRFGSRANEQKWGKTVERLQIEKGELLRESERRRRELWDVHAKLLDALEHRLGLYERPPK